MAWTPPWQWEKDAYIRYDALLEEMKQTSMSWRTQVRNYRMAKRAPSASHPAAGGWSEISKAPINWRNQINPGPLPGALPGHNWATMTTTLANNENYQAASMHAAVVGDAARRGVYLGKWAKTRSLLKPHPFKVSGTEAEAVWNKRGVGREFFPTVAAAGRSIWALGKRVRKTWFGRGAKRAWGATAGRLWRSTFGKMARFQVQRIGPATKWLGTATKAGAGITKAGYPYQGVIGRAMTAPLRHPGFAGVAGATTGLGVGFLKGFFGEIPSLLKEDLAAAGLGGVLEPMVRQRAKRAVGLQGASLNDLGAKGSMVFGMHNTRHGGQPLIPAR